jgi:hypothetical protein
MKEIKKLIFGFYFQVGVNVIGLPVYIVHDITNHCIHENCTYYEYEFYY